MNKEETKVVILCGGKGTRLRNVSESLPKPMVPIGDMPLLWHIMKGYHAQGYKDFVLCLGYKGNVIKDFFLNYHKHHGDVTIDGRNGQLQMNDPGEDWRVRMIETGDKTQTGARLYRVRGLLERDPHFLLTYGDGVSNVKIHELVEFHKKRKVSGTFTGVHEWSKYGKVRVNEEGIAEHFEEKPLLDDLVNGGFMVLNRKFLDYPGLKEDRPLETTIKELCEKKQMAVFRHDGFWYSMDEMREYEHLNKLWEGRSPPWKIWD